MWMDRLRHQADRKRIAMSSEAITTTTDVTACLWPDPSLAAWGCLTGRTARLGLWAYQPAAITRQEEK